MTSAAPQAATRYQGTFHAQPDQVSRVRAAVASHLAGCPVTDDALVVVSELATNALLHSDSRGEFFIVRCEVFPRYVWVEVEDLGGQWRHPQPGDRPHGLYIVDVLAGTGNWGTEMTGDGDRIVWVRLELAGEPADRA
jgi:anti-sigma regulatory factor (Ser/Thr protein kinase)